MKLAIQSPVLRRIVESIPFVKQCWVGLVCRAWPPWQVRYLSLEPMQHMADLAAIERELLASISDADRQRDQ